MKKKKSIIIGMVISIIVILMGACSSRQDNTAYNHILRIYQRAHHAQDSAIYNKATTLYKECIYECSSDKYENDDSIKLLLPKAMVQLLNVYQSASMPNECIAYFDSLRTEVDKKQTMHHNKVLTQYFKRDVYVLLAYATSRTDAEVEAAHIMDTALTMPLSYPTPERKFRDYTYAAGIYYCVPSQQEKVLKYGRLALDEIKLCQQKSGAQWLVAIMAKLYRDKGEIGKSIAMCREGFEVAEMCQDTLGMANSKKELADYLFQWQLYDDADKYSTESINLLEKLHNSNPMVETVAYTIKAKILAQKGEREEALSYLKKAKEISKELPYNSGSSDVDLLMGTILASDTTQGTSAQHYAEGMQLLRKVSKEATYKLRSQAFFELAKASFAHHDDTYGSSLLDSMYVILNTSNTPIFIEGAYDYALNYYLQKGDQGKIIQYSAAINRQKMAESKVGTMTSVAKSLARFEMDKQEAEMKAKMNEMETRKILEIFGIIAVLLILIGCFAYFIYKRKKMKQQHAQTKKELSNTKVALAKASEEKDKAEIQLKDIEKKEIGKVKAGISPQQVLAMKGDKKFKDYFNKAYPYFLTNLRRQIPHLTNKEELYCMMIALNCNNEELANTFNVARSSVVVAKYRIRKKLDLAEGESMEEYLTDILTKEAEK